MHLGFRVQCLLLLSDFNKNLNVSTNLKNSKTKFLENPSDGNDKK